jgi:hypothetical protein
MNFSSRAIGIKVLKRVMKHNNKNNNVAYLNMKLILSIRFEDRAPMESDPRGRR